MVRMSCETLEAYNENWTCSCTTVLARTTDPYYSLQTMHGTRQLYSALQCLQDVIAVPGN